MFIGVYRFAGEPGALQAAYERLLSRLPARSLLFHMCASTPEGLEVVDACPTREAFDAFAASAQFHDALAAAGLPQPQVRALGPAQAAFVSGQRVL